MTPEKLFPINDLNTIENLEDNIESLENDLEKAKSKLEFSKFLFAFEEFIPDREASAEYNEFRYKSYSMKNPRRFVQFFLNKRKFFISEISSYRYKDSKEIRTITIPIDKKTNEFLNDLKNVLEKHKDILGPITNGFPD